MLLGFLLLVVQLTQALPESGIAHLRSVEQKESLEKEEMKDEKTLRKERRAERRMERFTNRWQKLKARIEGKNAKEANQTADIWDDDRFRLGVILLAAAVALAILSILISLAGLLNFIAGLAALGGIVLIVWSLIEYYA